MDSSLLISLAALGVSLLALWVSVQCLWAVRGHPVKRVVRLPPDSPDLKDLVARLDGECRVALEGALGLTVARVQKQVTPEHFFMTLVAKPSRFSGELQFFDVPLKPFLSALEERIDDLPRFSLVPQRPELGTDLCRLLYLAARHAGLEKPAGSKPVTSVHVLLAALDDRELRKKLCSLAPSVESISIEHLRDRVAGHPPDPA